MRIAIFGTKNYERRLLDELNPHHRMLGHGIGRIIGNTVPTQRRSSPGSNR